MECTNHQQNEATGMCTYCGKPYCADCLVEVKGKMYCKADLGNVLDEAKSSATSATPVINISNANTNSNVNQQYANMGVGYYPSPKSKTVAILLCIFLGWLGIHRFYVGKVGTGILYMFSYGLFFIGVIVDIIMILTNSFTDKYGQRLV